MIHMPRGTAKTLAALVAAFAMAGTANAVPINLTLENVVLDDGGTASGTMNMNTYGFFAGGDVTTTAGSYFSAYDYNLSNGSSGEVSGNSLVLIQPAGNIELVLTLAQPSDGTIVNSDPITGGYEECTFACPVGVTAGVQVAIDTTDYSPSLEVPEPMTLAILSSGLLVLSAVRRRRAAGRRA